MVSRNYYVIEYLPAFFWRRALAPTSLGETAVAIYTSGRRGFEKVRALLNTKGRMKKTRRNSRSLFVFFSFFSTGTYVLFCTEQKYKLFMKDEVTAAASLPPYPFLSTPALPPFARIHRVPFACHRTAQHLRFSPSLNLPRPQHHKSSPDPALRPLPPPECRAR